MWCLWLVVSCVRAGPVRFSVVYVRTYVCINICVCTVCVYPRTRARAFVCVCAHTSKQTYFIQCPVKLVCFLTLGLEKKKSPVNI